ncbi:2'-5' RNA ligase family protein [Echinicola soli]|uniref:2'-5' RNA ligase family protein n=2 Tax=Echinicola soli TaxID=2591634 RepID=A0A514CFW7_9BACT|nr:2'-5' RNA ligase family protein [Echinicola soli]
MPRSMQKYFVAIVPPGEVQVQAQEIKEAVREKYNAKHALKSPAHVTLKMPFVWNEHKEDKLFGLLRAFFKERGPFPVEFKGIGRFGRRIMYARVHGGDALVEMQEAFRHYCRRELKLNEELSDKAYTPHVTLVYSDLKKNFFDECWAMLKERGFYGNMEVQQVALLKKENYRWQVLEMIDLGNSQG